MALLKQNDKDQAIERLTQGVQVATQRGDVMARNDMVRMLEELGRAGSSVGRRSICASPGRRRRSGSLQALRPSLVQASQATFSQRLWPGDLRQYLRQLLAQRRCHGHEGHQ